MSALWLMGAIGLVAAAPARMDAALSHYLALQRELADDKAAHVAHHAQALEAALSAAEKAPPASKEARARFLGEVREARRVLKEGAADFASGDVARARKHFFALSKPLIRYVGHFRAAEGRYLTFYCPMKKAGWLQTEKVAANPYYGKDMDKCGDRVRTKGEPPAPR